jgi:hypothetical protein
MKGAIQNDDDLTRAKQVASFYGVLAKAESSTETIIANHTKISTMHNEISTKAFQFFATHFTNDIMTRFRNDLDQSRFHAVWSGLNDFYTDTSNNRPFDLVSINYAAATFSYDTKLPLPTNVFMLETVMCLEIKAYHLNNPTRPMIGRNTIDDIRPSIPMNDATFTATYPGVHIHLPYHTKFDLLREFLQKTS